MEFQFYNNKEIEKKKIQSFSKSIPVLPVSDMTISDSTALTTGAIPLCGASTSIMDSCENSINSHLEVNVNDPISRSTEKTVNEFLTSETVSSESFDDSSHLEKI